MHRPIYDVYFVLRVCTANLVCNFHTQDSETVKQDLSEELLMEQTLQHTTIYIAKQIFPPFCIPGGTFIITT